MLEQNLVPSQLLKPEEHFPIPIAEQKRVNGFRGLLVSYRLTLLVFKFLGLKLIGRLDAATVGKRLGAFCQQNGILWIKVGQVLSMRSDIFPRELCTAMARLQEKAEGFSTRLVKSIIRQELGGPLEEFFSVFDENPCAAASIAQVHKARLKKEKAWVAIKVRRPGIDRVFRSDMMFISRLFRFLGRFSIMAFMRWDDMLLELEQVLSEELDYRYELSNQERLKESLKPHGIYVPEMYPQYCGRDILVMEFIDAVSMADYLMVEKKDPQRIKRWLEKNKIDRAEVVQTLFHSYLRQILEDNLFHADLHPGNIFLLKNSQVALLDFGSIGSTEGDMRRKYDMYLESLVNGEYAKAIDVFFLIMPDLPTERVVPAKEEIQRILHAWGVRCDVQELPYKEKSASFIFDTMTRIMAKHKVHINWAFFKVIRGWTTMDTSIRELNPQANLIKSTRTYMVERRKREFKQILYELPRDLLKIQNLIDYPKESLEMAIYRGAMVRRMAQVFDTTTSRVSRLVAKLFGLGSAIFFLLSIGIGLTFLLQHSSLFSPLGGVARILGKIPPIDIQIWFILLIFSIRSWRWLAFLSRRFAKQD